jgi:hypothetical protein
MSVLNTADVLFKDYLNVPSNIPIGQWFDENDAYNQYVIGDSIFVDTVPKVPTFSTSNIPSKYSNLTMEGYEADTTRVVERFIKLRLTQIPNSFAWTAADVDGENVLKNAFQFNYGGDNSRPFNYNLYVDSVEIPRSSIPNPWIFNYKAGYITFYNQSLISSLAGSVVELTYCRYMGSLGLSQFQGAGGFKIVSGSNLRFQLAGVNSQPRHMNAFGIGIGEDLSLNPYSILHSAQTITAIGVRAMGIYEPTTYDISIGILGGDVVGNSIEITPLYGQLYPKYNVEPTDTDLMDWFDCNGTYGNRRTGGGKMEGGIMTSTDRRVGYASMSVPVGGSVTIKSPTLQTTTWTLSFHYKHIHHYNDGSGSIILYNANDAATLTTGIVLIYNENINKFIFGDPNAPTTYDADEYVGEWLHIRITCDGTDTVLYVNGVEVGTYGSAASFDTLVIGGYEGLINETAFFVDDIRIYSSVQTLGDMTDIGLYPATGIARLETEISLPADSVVYAQISGGTGTEIVEIELYGSKTSMNSGLPYAFQTLTRDVSACYGILPMNEDGAYQDIQYPYNSFAYIDTTAKYSYLYANIHATIDYPVLYDVSIVSVNLETMEEEMIWNDRITVKPFGETKSIGRYTNELDMSGLEQWYLCDGTYKNIVGDDKLMGGIFQRVDSIIGNEALFIPKGTGATIYDISLSENWTMTMWYKHIHTLFDGNHVIIAFNQSIANDGLPYGVIVEYDASLSRVRLGVRGLTFGYTAYYNYDLTDWTNIGLQREGNVYRLLINGVSVLSITNADVIWTFIDIVEFCSWTSALLKTSAYIKDIRIYEGIADLTGITDITTATYMAGIAKVDFDITLVEGTHINVLVRPVGVLPEHYVSIELMPELTQNVDIMDTDGLYKFRTTEQTIGNYTTDVVNNRALYKYVDGTIPSGYVRKLKQIKGFSFMKTDDVATDASYIFVINYGPLVDTGTKYIADITYTYDINIDNVKTRKEYTLAKKYIMTYDDEVADDMVAWFPCDGYRNNFMDGSGVLDGGIFVKHDRVIGYESLMIYKGSGAMVRNVGLGSTWSLSFWYKFVETTFIQSVPIVWFSSVRSDSDTNLIVSYDPSNSWVNIGTLYNETTDNEVINMKEWQHVVLERNDDVYTVYIGAWSYSFNGPVNWDIEGVNIEFAHIESANIASSAYVDDIRIYNRVLNGSERSAFQTVVSQEVATSYVSYELKDTVLVPEGSMLSINVSKPDIRKKAIRDNLYVFVYGDEVNNDVIISLLTQGNYAQSGSALNPAYSFFNDRDTGIFNPSADKLGITVGGVEVARFGNTTEMIGDVSFNYVYIVDGDISHATISALDASNITASNNVHIAISHPTYGDNSNNALYVGGDVYVAGAITEVSDLRLKTNIVPISPVLTKICSLNGVKYQMIGNEQEYTGFIAQAVQEHIPEVVRGNSGYLAISYTGLIPYLVESIKELKDEINELKMRLNEVENK